MRASEGLVVSGGETCLHASPVSMLNGLRLCKNMLAK